MTPKLPIQPQMITSDKVYLTQKHGFSQAIVANGLIFTSGQVGWERSGQLTGDGSFQAQAIQAFKNIKNLLIHAKSSMEKVIHLRFYVTEVSLEHRKLISNLLNQYFPDAYKPASTLLCIQSLAREELLIEIEAIALINQ